SRGGMILAGDMGGTHTRLAVFDDGGGRGAASSAAESVHTYPSHEHAGLGEIVRRFLDETGARVSAACFGVAGPVKDGRSVATNLPWIIDAGDLARELGARTWGINDLEATAWGIGVLAPGELAERLRVSPRAGGTVA